MGQTPFSVDKRTVASVRAHNFVCSCAVQFGHGADTILREQTYTSQRLMCVCAHNFACVCAMQFGHGADTILRGQTYASCIPRALDCLPEWGWVGWGHDGDASDTHTVNNTGPRRVVWGVGPALMRQFKLALKLILVLARCAVRQCMR